MRLYQSCCISVSPMKSFVSFFGGREVATSFFTRRSINGRKTVCNFLMTLSCPSLLFVLNHWSNCSLSPKTSGKRKFNRAQSSCRLEEKSGRSINDASELRPSRYFRETHLFWRGVPVINKRKSTLINLTAFDRLEFSL